MAMWLSSFGSGTLHQAVLRRSVLNTFRASNRITYLPAAALVSIVDQEVAMNSSGSVVLARLNRLGQGQQLLHGLRLEALIVQTIENFVQGVQRFLGLFLEPIRGPRLKVLDFW